MAFYDDMRRFGCKTALVTEGGQAITYDAAAGMADAFGAHVEGQVLISILAGNDVESVVAYLGCLRHKATAALLTPNIHSDLLQKLLRVYRPHCVWLPRNRSSEISREPELYALGNYVLAAYSKEPLEVHEKLALLMTTSGSTGSPKFVRQSYRNLAANADSIVESLQITGQDRAITSMPMHYVYGLSVINSHLATGASVILTNASVMEKRFWGVLEREGATSLSGVPHTYECLKRLRWDEMDCPTLKVMTQAGGKLRAELVTHFAGACKGKGLRFYVMYGAAEATARMAYLPPDLALEKPASIGVAIPGGGLWLEDESGGTITGSSVVGELTYRGANVSLGYAERREDLALGDERKGILKTGDLAWRDEDGAYYIVGRKNRFVKLFGNRVDLEQVEQLVRNAGFDCACTGDDESLRVYIAGDCKEDEVVTFVQQLTKLHHSVLKTTVVDRIPRNEAGKILYAELP